MELRYVNLLLFLCCLIGSKYNPNNIRLCRDDGLGVFKNTSSPQCEKIKNTFQKMFKMKGCDPTSPNLITKRKQQRKIWWFNPPYSTIVKTKIGKFFLQLIKKHFRKEYKFHKTFSRNTLNLGYFCMHNIKTKTNVHSREILQNAPLGNAKHCNCQQKENCSMNGACLKESLVYCGTISCNNKNYKLKLYRRSCKRSFNKGNSD